MATRRMFSKTITNSGKFLKMPATSRLFYYDLGMNADDDGYAEWFTTMRMSGASQQDLDVLRVNGFVKVFDDNVLVVLDWKENNYIQKDRYTPSKYLDVYKMDTECIQNGHSGKVRLGKVRLGKVTKATEAVAEANESESKEIPEIIKAFEAVNQACKRMYGNTTQRKACQDLIDTHGYEKVLGVIRNTLPKTNPIPYFPTIMTPLQLFDKWSSLENAIIKKKIEQQNIKKVKIV